MPPKLPVPEITRRLRTRMIHGRHRTRKWEYDHHVVPPITSSAAFRLGSAQRGAQGFVRFAHTDGDTATEAPIYIYDRLDEPTSGMLEENIALAERGDFALSFSSGMAAISAALGALVRSGERIVAHRTLYGCTWSLLTNWLPRYNIQTDFVDLSAAERLADVVRPTTRVVYFETPVNPDMRLIDIAALRRQVDEINRGREMSNRVLIVVDNTFATPYCQRPLTLGADVVVDSLTKAMGGFGTDVGGAVVGPHWLHDALILYRKDFGGCLTPKTAWNVLVYGLPTLATRMVNYQKSAHHVAKFLANHPKVAYVRYPGLESFPQYELAKRQMVDENGRFAPGSMLYFVLKDAGPNGERGERLIDWIAENSYCITLAVSLGQIKTLIECPYSMTHAALSPEKKQAAGLEPGGVRLSVGLEDWQDLMADLDAALAAV
jgi:methionine-gamma-lyase